MRDGRPGGQMSPNLVKPKVSGFIWQLTGFAAHAIENQVAFLKGDFPNFGHFDFAIGTDDEIALVWIKFRDVGIVAGGNMPDTEFKLLKDAVGTARAYEDLRLRPELTDYFAWNQFLVALDINDGFVDWHSAEAAVVAWLKDVPLQRALDHNLKRVQAAIPSPPQYDLKRVQDALWVLECEDVCTQGTAFDLGSYVVTNHHVVDGTKAMMAFRASEPSRKFPIRVVAQNAALDLAIIDIPDAERPRPLAIDADEAASMDHVAVCGFPNYRLGDSGVLTPGLVIGTRRISGVQRLLTNAPIVAGMSGGPAIGGKGAVIGVCVTGADNFHQAQDTENHGIIPISALAILMG